MGSLEEHLTVLRSWRRALADDRGAPPHPATPETYDRIRRLLPVCVRHRLAFTFAS